MAGRPCPKSYHPWLNVQVAVSHKQFPSGVCTVAKSNFSTFVSVSLTVGASAPSARSRLTRSCVAIGVFEGRDANHRDLGRLRERDHVNPHQSHLQCCVQLWRPQHRKLMAMTEQVPRRPTKARHRGSGHGDRLREQPLLRGEEKSPGETCLGPSQIQQWGTFMKNRDVLPRPAVAG